MKLLDAMAQSLLSTRAVCDQEEEVATVVITLCKTKQNKNKNKKP
jgi:hypothetical protein